MARPNLSYLKNLALFVFGLPFGALTGLTGLGSSVALLPTVRWLLGLRPARAAATALAVTGFAALAGLLSYARHGDVWIGLAALLTLGQILGAGWGARLAEAQSPAAAARGRIAWAMLVIALGLALAAQGRGVWAWQPWLLPLRGAAFWASAVAVSVVVGLVSRFLTLGGVFLVPAAVDLLRLPPHLAQGTALAVLLLAALPGMLIQARRGALDPQATVWLSVGAVFGALAGAYWASEIRSENLLLTLYGLLLTLIGVAMLWRRDPPPETQGAEP